MTEPEIIKITEELFRALNFMHSQNLVHRDLKPQNILVSNAKNVEIKLTDFGFATYFEEEEKLELPLGTPYYLSP